MTDETPTRNESLDDEAYAAIAEICSRHDFPFEEASLEGDVLRLTPESLEALPEARKLGSIADELEGRFRYVAFAVPEGREVAP